MNFCDWIFVRYNLLILTKLIEKVPKMWRSLKSGPTELYRYPYAFSINVVLFSIFIHNRQTIINGVKFGIKKLVRGILGLKRHLAVLSCNTVGCIDVTVVHIIRNKFEYLIHVIIISAFSSYFMYPVSSYFMYNDHPQDATVQQAINFIENLSQSNIRF